MAAIERRQARETLLQMRATNLAMWGKAEDVRRFTAALTGDDGATDLRMDDGSREAMRALGVV